MRAARLLLVVIVMVLPGSGAASAQDAPPRSDLAALRYTGGFLLRSEDGRYSLRLTAGIQMRYSFVDYDPAVVGNGEDYSNFFIRRARLWLAGHAFDPRLSYYIHLQLEPSNQVNAHDLWLQYAFSDLLQLGAGRNKIAYGLEFLNGGMALSLVDRSIMYGETDIERGAGTPGSGPSYPGGGTAEFGLSSIAPTGFPTGGMGLYRSQGVQLSGRGGPEEGSSFEYQLGLWQGRATRGLSNRGTGHLLSARIGWHPFGWVEWATQGDLGRTPAPRAAVWLSGFVNRDTGTVGDYDEWGVDLALATRWRGLAVDAEWARERWDPEGLELEAERQGWRLQAGWTLPGSRFEVIARTAEIERLSDPTASAAIASGLGLALLREEGGARPALERRLREWTVGGAWYPAGVHRHKLVVDLSRLVREFAEDPGAGVGRADDQVDLRGRVMVQLLF